MDVKDLRTEAALSERNNDGSKYSQSAVALQCNRNKSYQDIGSNALGKAEGAPVRPCAVIGPDRVVPPPASNDPFLKKGSVEPWPSPDNAYRRPPEYPHRLANPNPTRNISPRQTFQENMQRINVPPTYNAVRHSDSAHFNQIQDRNVSISKNVKPNMAPEAKYCDVPYAVNSLANEPKSIREPEMYMQSVNPSLTRTVPHVWPPGSVNVAAPRTYSASDSYQYQQYSNCANQRPTVIPVARPHRTIQEDAAFMYSEHYYPDANARFKPFPHVKERYPQPRYEYLGNYPGQFHPPPPIQPPKYEIPKSGQSHLYPVYPHVKYLENRVPEPTMESYQRQANHQPHYNIPFRNQVIHPPYGQVPSNAPQKVHPYPPEASIKAVASNKLHYENNTKMYIDYENARSKPYPVADNYFVNEMNRYHQVKNPMAMPNYSPLGMRAIPPHQYYVKDNPQMRPFEYMPHFRNFEPHLNANSVLRHAPQFSPNTLAISPTDSSASNDTLQTHGISQEDCGYVSQSSSASVRSLDSGIYRLPHEYYKKPEYKYGPVVGSSPTLPKTDVNANDKQKQMNVRQFLSMWNEGEEENPESNNTKEIIIQTGSSEASNYAKLHASNQDQLYVLGLVNVPSEELSKYEHIEKISKLPENIKGYNNLELYSRFEEAMESCNTTPKVTPKEYQMPCKEQPAKMFVEPLPRPISPLDVEAKISQSVIHKEVGCNFEIRPCTPKMLNVEVAAPAQNVLGERSIEKVTNPNSKIEKSPLPTKSDEGLNCHSIKKPESSFAITDNPSCKMTCSPYSSNNLEPIKANYSLQDFNSGVCLASLPQLDNEIELNFAEVNQQFINANKGDCLSPVEKSSIQQSESGLHGNGNVETDLNEKSNSDPEKALNKLSKYRKLKASAEKIIRTDSVIIKNPENTKNIEDKLLGNSFNPMNVCSPINLSSQSSHWHDSPFVPHENKDAEMALDFSLNKEANDLPIIDVEKDIVTKSFQINNFPLATDLERKHVLSSETKSFSKETTQVATEVAPQCMKKDQTDRECYEPESLCSSEINDASISHIKDSLLPDPSNDQKSNDNDRCLNTNDYKEDVSDILETRENVVPKQLDFSTVENDLTLNKERGWLSTNKKTTDMETSCNKYCENVKKVFSPDQYNNIEQIENDFEHDEISANLEKLFRESDEDLPKSDLTTGSNTADISVNSEATNTSESLLITRNTFYKTNYRLNKELFSPWMQKLLTYNEGICLFSNNTTVDNTLCKNEITKQLKEIDYFEPENDVKVDNVPVSAIQSQSIVHKIMPEENLDNYLDILSKKSTQIPSESLTKQCDTRKIKKICIKKITGNSTKTFSSYAIDINKKEMKKRKKRLHKFKSTRKSPFNGQILCMDELRGPQKEEPPCEHKHEIKFEANIEKANIMSSNESIKQTKVFIPENVIQNCHENQNTSDEAIDSSDVSKNPLNLGNSVNKISLTENYSKILTYCNTPEDEEQISTHDTDNNIEYQHVKQPHIAFHESKEDDSTDSSKKTAHCLININSDNDPNKLSSRPDESTNYITQENCVSRFSPCESGIMAVAANSETVLDSHLKAENIEHQKTKKFENKEINRSCSNLCSSYSKESPNDEIKTQKKSDDALSCTDDIPKPMHSDTAAEDLTGSFVHDDRNMAGLCVTCEHSLVEIPKRSLDKNFKELNTADQNHSLKKKSSFNDSNNLIANEDFKDSTTGTPLSNISSELLSFDESLEKANKELNTTDLNYTLKEESSFNDSNNRIANEEFKESATDTPVNSRAPELLSFDKSLDKVSKELNTSDQNYSCLEDSSYNDSNNLIANEELKESNTDIPPNILVPIDSSNKLDEGFIEDSENLQLGEKFTAVVTDISDIICDSQVGEANKLNINEEEDIPNYDNIVVIENKKQPIIISENSMRDFADTVNENISNSSMSNQHKAELISPTESNIGIPSECENSILNHKSDLITKDFVDAVVSKDQPDKVNTGIVNKIFFENETGVAISEDLLLKSGSSTSDHDLSEIITASKELKVLNVALNNLHTSISSETNKKILALEKEFNKEIHTDLECMIETKSIEVMHHKNVSDNYTTSEQMNISTDEMPGLEKELSVENNDYHKDFTSNLNKCESDQNNKMLDYKPKIDSTNNSNSIPDKWIEERKPFSPNKVSFSTTEEDFILYDNSEESLCYPVVNNSLTEIENETCIIPDPCIHESPVKSRLALKRSFSDSALNSIKTRDTSERQMLDNTPMWPSKRQKLYQFKQSEQQIISENICNFIQNNRRNSVSSYYNAENVSFCILIDDDCILTDENEEDKICFAEVAEDCITETNTLEENVEEVVCCSEETELNLSDSVIMDYNDKSIQETWLDDVACVETVVSDDIAEEISNDAPLSPIDTNSEYEETGALNSDLSDPTNEYNIENEDNIPSNGYEMDFYSNSYEDDDVIHDREPLSPGHMICNAKNIESEKPLSYSEGCSVTPDYTHAFCTQKNGIKSDLPEDKENIYDSNLEFQSFESNTNLSNNRANLEINCNTPSQPEKSSNQHIEEVYFPESSMDNVIFNYNKKDEDDSYSPTSSSPEVSSTTSEDKSSSILLKITNYNGSRVSEVNEVNSNRPRCKFTESKDYSHSQEFFPKRPLMTKAARKYIPPLKESIRDLKVQLPLPQQRLLKLKQLKLAKSEPKAIKQNNHTVPKKQKPNFEDVLKSIDEVQIKMHKEKNKKTKNIVPKVVIKKNENGSHYTSSSSKQSVDPDLTGRKWQPWVFLEKNHFIDNMAISNKTKAFFSHRKNTYVLTEKFQKYKSASNCSAKFVISQPNSGDSSKGHLKYTIRLKHVY